MALPDDFLYRLKAANRIDEIIASYVPLQRSGRYYKCRCPFHSERTPSFVVYPDTESFYCFGCGAGGDVITFVMRMASLSYIEAVKLLAERSGMAMPEDVRRGDDFTRKKQRLLEMNKKAARFFFENLRGSKGLEARAYLKKRGLEPGTISRYGLGYACPTWTTLKDFMLSEGYSEEELIDASLIVRSEKTGRTHDFFINRVMFPFINLQGNIVGFGGRTLSVEDSRKYLNTKDTVVYKKSSFLFSMNFAKTMASKQRRILLCEGNMDVVSLNQAGFENSVATCGTSITSQHALVLAQYCNEVIICYDADGAGQKASDKAISTLSQAGITTRVIKMEGAKDPDEYILKFGKERFKHLLDNSSGAVDFNLKRCENGIDMGTDVGRVEYLKRACGVLADIPTDLEREVYLSKVAQESGISKTVLERSVEDILKKRRAKADKKSWQEAVSSVSIKTDVKSGEPSASNKLTKAEEGIIAYLFANPDEAERISEGLSAEYFPTALLREVYASLTEKLRCGSAASLAAFNEEFDGEQMGRIARIYNLTKSIVIDRQTADDYMRVLLENGEADNRNQLNHQNQQNGLDDGIDLSEFARRKREKLGC